MKNEAEANVHASTIAWQGRAALIIGAAGSGKSSLALHLMALGCELIADDQTQLANKAGVLIARCPKTISGKIEARAFGILDAKSATSAKVVCVIDLDTVEHKRLPDEKTKSYCGIDIRLFHNCGIEVLPFAVLQYLKSYGPL